MYRKTLLLAVLMLAADLAAASGIDRLHHFLDGLHSMRADFEQSVATNKDERARYSKGTLYLERPGRFRWDYLDPAGQFVIADGSRVWLYDAELAQVSHQAQADGRRIQQGDVPADHPRLLQTTQAAQARRRRQRDPIGQLLVGHPAVLLEQLEQPAIGSIEVVR